MRATRATAAVRGVTASCLLALTMLCGTAAAQLGANDIIVTIKDPSGSLLSGVTVVYNVDGGPDVKATELPTGECVVTGAGGKAHMVIEHPAYGPTVVETTLPTDTRHGLLIVVDGSGHATTKPTNRLGGFELNGNTPLTTGGVSCATGVGCQFPDQNGHGACGVLAATSDADPNFGFIVADNFQAVSAGSITDVCWWGVYLDFALGADCGATSGADNFTFRFYADDAGGLVPGTLGSTVPTGAAAARFLTGNVVLFVAEYQFEESLAGPSVSAGECVWMSIQNRTATGPVGDNCAWLWSTSPGLDNRSAQNAGGGYAGMDYDCAWCVNIGVTNCFIAGPANDDCDTATAISGEGTFPFDNTLANNSGPAHAVCDFFADGGDTDHDLWYCWTAPCTSTVTVETCGLTGVDTKLNAYDGCSCPVSDANLIVCNDDFCGFQSHIEFSATSGSQYLIRVGTFPGAAGGSGSFFITCGSTIPENDLCENAIGPLAVPSSTMGTTVNATTDTGAMSCGSGTVTSPGVWYTVIGTGNTMTASLCDGSTTYDSKLNVYCGECDPLSGLVCVTGIDDFCGLQSQVSWCSQAGAEYLVLVHGFGGDTGSFTLDITDDGVACSGAIMCLATGACCLDGACVQATSADCAAMGGDYQGDGTNCPGPGAITYSSSTCGSAFEDISGTGTNLGLSDDSGVMVGLGFSFQFFGVNHTMVGVSSNGYLTFGASLTDLSNDPIPNAATPNDLIAVLWDDLNPSAGGAVFAQSFADHFIAQWNMVPQFGTSDSNTFQVRLNSDGSIEMRYVSITPEAFAGDYTIGVENPTGTAGASVPGASIGGGPACVAFAKDPGDDPCNLPPVFTEGPCGQTLSAIAGIPISFDVTATDPDGDMVTLSQMGAPAGAVFTPPLPTSGTPTATTNFFWIPGPGDIAANITFTATDSDGRSTPCNVVINVNQECFLLIGTQQIFAPMTPQDFVLVSPIFVFPITLSVVPSFSIPNDPSLAGIHIYTQVFMNAYFLPTDHLRLSNGLDFRLDVPGSATVIPYGPASGVSHWATEPPALGGHLRTAFSIG